MFSEGSFSREYIFPGTPPFRYGKIERWKTSIHTPVRFRLNCTVYHSVPQYRDRLMDSSVEMVINVKIVLLNISKEMVLKYRDRLH